MFSLKPQRSPPLPIYKTARPILKELRDLPTKIFLLASNDGGHRLTRDEKIGVFFSLYFLKYLYELLKQVAEVLSIPLILVHTVSLQGR